MYGPGRVYMFFGILAVLAGAGLVRLVGGPVRFQIVFALLVFSAIAAAAFLLGRAHAKDRHDRKQPPPS